MRKTPRILAWLFARPLLVLWAIVLLIGAEMRIIATRLEDERASHAAADGIYWGRFLRLSDAVQAFWGKTRADVEQAFNGGQPLRGASVLVFEGAPAAAPSFRPEGDRTIFEDARPHPATTPAAAARKVVSLHAAFSGAAIHPELGGWTVRLHFLDDRLIGATAAGPKRTPYVSPSLAWHLAQVSLVVAIGVAGLVAATCVGIIAFASRWRRPVAAVGLLALLFAGVVAAGLVGDRRNLILGRPAAGWAWVVLVATMAWFALVPRRHRRRAGPPRCAACRYDLTGNESGTCPECGTLTPRGKLDRWQDRAAKIEHVNDDADDQPSFTADLIFEPQLLELKPPSDARQTPWDVGAVAPMQFACYGCDVALEEPENQDPSTDAEDEKSTAPVPPGLVYACPTCGSEVSVAALPENGLLACPACGAEFFAAADASDEDRELAEQLALDYEVRERHLADLATNQVLLERRSLFRTRTYFAVGIVFFIGLALQLASSLALRLAVESFGAGSAGYVAATVAALLLAVVCFRKIRELNAELAKPVLAEPATPPDFSTLSDGSEYADTAARNLERLGRRTE
jgi:DNA-directed RNA polymerase subunit RPC12/RpoP